jgi:hypothetical protein
MLLPAHGAILYHRNAAYIPHPGTYAPPAYIPNPGTRARRPILPHIPETRNTQRNARSNAEASVSTRLLPRPVTLSTAPATQSPKPARAQASRAPKFSPKPPIRYACTTKRKYKASARDSAANPMIKKTLRLPRDACRSVDTHATQPQTPRIRAGAPNVIPSSNRPPEWRKRHVSSSGR